MDLIKLQYFISVASGANMQSAADALNVSQSTLSMAIKSLERELGVSLFQKVGRKLVLTEAGVALRKDATELLYQAEQIKQHMRTFSGSLGCIRFSTEVPDFTTEASIIFSRDQDFKYDFAESRGAHQELLADLATGKTDFAVTLTDESNDVFRSSFLFEEPLVLLVNNVHHLSGEASVTLRQLQNETLLTQEKGYGYHTLCETVFASVGLALPPLHIVPDPDQVASSARLSKVIALVPYYVAQRQNGFFADLKCVPIEDATAVRRVYITQRKDHKMLPAAEAFYNEICAIPRRHSKQ